MLHHIIWLVIISICGGGGDDGGGSDGDCGLWRTSMEGREEREFGLNAVRACGEGRGLSSDPRINHYTSVAH